MFKNFDTKKIDEYLKKNFSIIYEFEFNGLLLLFGGSIKDIIMNKKNIHDIDFILLTNKKDNVEVFLKKYKLDYKKNKYHGYNIKYNNISIDITCVEDLYNVGHFSTDFLFYDINRKILIPIGIRRTIEKNTIIDYYYNGYYKPKRRIKKAKEFVKYMNHKKEVKVKYKYNRPFNLLKSFILRPYKLFKSGDINAK